MTRLDWVRGDSLGLDIPAHSDALAAGGCDFLTRAFRASGIIDSNNAVTAITECREVEGGSTGRKLLLAVNYQQPLPHLHQQLFVKFSRDFADAHRDAARVQMELEVHFALLSRDPDFPIQVPVCYFSDFHHHSGTGILITQRIPYDCDGVEPHYPKSQDFLMPEPLAHYEALIRALARLAGTHKAGKLPDLVEDYFPFDPDKLVVSQRAPYTPEEIRKKVARYTEFVQKHPQLIPAHLSSAAFLSRLADEAPRFQAKLPQVHQLLRSQPDMIALCHWNAHVDNAWFWKDAQQLLQCGLMDWGNVSQMNVAMALWGCLSAAEPELWDDHLQHLLQLFVQEFADAGGPALEIGQLHQHLLAYVAMMGLAWMLDAPYLILKYAPDVATARNRFDPLVQQSERARSQLLILTVFLNLWEKSDMETLIKKLGQDG